MRSLFGQENVAFWDYCGILALVTRVSGLWLKVDASRRQSDPRKSAKVPAIMVRFRGKTGPAMHCANLLDSVLVHVKHQFYGIKREKTGEKY